MSHDLIIGAELSVPFVGICSEIFESNFFGFECNGFFQFKFFKKSFFVNKISKKTVKTFPNFFQLKKQKIFPIKMQPQPLKYSHSQSLFSSLLSIHNKYEKKKYFISQTRCVCLLFFVFIFFNDETDPDRVRWHFMSSHSSGCDCTHSRNCLELHIHIFLFLSCCVLLFFCISFHFLPSVPSTSIIMKLFNCFTSTRRVSGKLLCVCVCKVNEINEQEGCAHS